jgi:hypothetical protein
MHMCLEAGMKALRTWMVTMICLTVCLIWLLGNRIQFLMLRIQSVSAAVFC